MRHRDYTYLGATQSLCPECLAVVPTKIITRGARVYFRKRCPQHGEREDFICSDVAYYDRLEYSLPAKIPVEFGVEPKHGCPLDCGLCTEHEQHTCVAVVEITGNCNLTCPMCYAGSAPGGQHRSLAECQASIDRIVATEGRAEVIQLSGGEPTVHPQLPEILDYALSQAVDYVMINTNGIRFARDPALVEMVAQRRERVEIYFQMDGLREECFTALRGEPLLQVKLAAIEKLGAAGVHITLVSTLQPGVNDDQLGPLIEFGLARPWITGISFQPATYSGRHVLPAELEQRITFPDVIKGISAQTNGLFRESDFMPLPCAHPNCHSLSIGWRHDGTVTPLTRFIDAEANLDLLANGISFTRRKSRDLIMAYLGRQGCCAGGCGEASTPEEPAAALVSLGESPATRSDGECSAALPETDAFFAQTLAEQIGAENLFRITITSFLDAYNFDVRRVMKCCTHHVLPSGHVIPFCAYNVLYRSGHVPLPELKLPAFAERE
jgi:uncharacterized radical SAM superfamily Fe-S cluster-containing enzyme